MHTVYFLTCPISRQVKWVGVSNNPKTRMANHLKESRRCNAEKFDWIAGLGDKTPVLTEVASFHDRKQAFNCESFLTSEIDNLFNRNIGPKRSAETIQKFSAKMLGRNWTTEQREKILNKIRSPEHRKMVSEKSKNTTANLCKMIKCSNGKSYSSISLAAKELGIQRANIGAVLNKRRKLAGGFVFTFEQE